MDPETTRPRRGRDELLRLLGEADRDVRRLDLPGFRDWLGEHLRRWSRDPAFRERTRIREIRRSHPALAELERRVRDAEADDERAPEFSRLEALDRDIRGASRAVLGLEKAVESAEPGARAPLRRKLEHFRARAASLRAERETLLNASAARRALLALREELERLRRAVGIQEAEARLAALQRERGLRSGRFGSSFEDVAARGVARCVIPELEAEQPEIPGRLEVLRGVTLGAARTEIDQLVVRAVHPGEPVRVLALVEAKRNINDLAHGLRSRLENLAWLTGDAGGHDPAAYRTRRFPEGRFDRPVEHEQDGERYVLAPESFAPLRSQPAAAPAPDRVVLVTRPGPLWGMGSGPLGRLAHRVATDAGWDPASERYLARLLEWTLSLTHSLESPDVLRAYAASEPLARRVIFV